MMSGSIVIVQEDVLRYKETFLNMTCYYRIMVKHRKFFPLDRVPYESVKSYQPPNQVKSEFITTWTGKLNLLFKFT